MQSDVEHSAGGWLTATRAGLDLPALISRMRRRLEGAFGEYWRAHAAVFATAAITILGAVIVSRIYGFPIDFTIYDTLSILPSILTAGFLALASLVQLAIHRPKSPIRFLWRKFTGDWQLPRRLVYGLPVILVSTLFMSAFSSMKSAISVIQPYYLDPAIAHFDRMLFLGHDAWQVLQPVLGYPIVTFGINIAYNVWLLMVCTSFAAAAMMVGRHRLRAQYLIAFFLCWVLIGSFLATVLSSVGPCFYAAFYDADPYAGLMAYLQGVNETYPIWALPTQQMLLDTYNASETGFGSGISAMPSMHLAMMTLMVIFSFRFTRWLGWLSSIYLAVIYTGSIHLGWHYATDGLVSIALVPGIWWLSGKIAALPYRGRNEASAAAFQ